MTSANCYLWVTLCVIYYGVSLSATSMAGNPFHNNGFYQFWGNVQKSRKQNSTFWQCRISCGSHCRCLCQQGLAPLVRLLGDDHLGLVANPAQWLICAISNWWLCVDEGEFVDKVNRLKLPQLSSWKQFFLNISVKGHFAFQEKLLLVFELRFGAVA